MTLRFPMNWAHLNGPWDPVLHFMSITPNGQVPPQSRNRNFPGSHVLQLLLVTLARTTSLPCLRFLLLSFPDCPLQPRLFPHHSPFSAGTDSSAKVINLGKICTQNSCRHCYPCVTVRLQPYVALPPGRCSPMTFCIRPGSWRSPFRKRRRSPYDHPEQMVPLLSSLLHPT